MSRLSMLFHESLTASEILFVEFPLFLLFPVISWLVADDEALLSSSLLKPLTPCDVCKTSLKNGPVSSRISNRDPHDVPQCMSEGYLQDIEGNLPLAGGEILLQIVFRGS